MKELIEIQSELNAPKNQFNKFGGYKYRSTEDIIEALKPLLKKHGCFLNISDEVGLIGTRYYVKAIARIFNSEGNSVVSEAFAREDESQKGMSTAQITGATSSYARKYALNGLFAIDDTKDDDTTNKCEKEECKDVEQSESKNTLFEKHNWLNAGTKEFKEARDKIKKGETTLQELMKTWSISRQSQIELCK